MLQNILCATAIVIMWTLLGYLSWILINLKAAYLGKALDYDCKFEIYLGAITFVLVILALLFTSLEEMHWYICQQLKSIKERTK